MSKTDELLNSIEGEITPAQAAELLELEMYGDEGDTATAEKGAQPGASAGEDDPGKQDAGAKTGPDAVDESQLTPDNAVILSKDGKHTIGFEKLVEARETAKDLRAKLEEAQQQLAALQSQAQARADAGAAPTQMDKQVAAAQAAIDDGADPSIFGDFSEEALAKGIQTLIAQKVDERVNAIVAKKLEPIEVDQMKKAQEAHYSAIYEKHPDADSIVESQQLDAWIKSKPSFLQSAYRSVLEKGSTEEIIQFFDTYKQETGATQGQQDTGDKTAAAKLAAQRAVANAQAAPPSSLTDIPGAPGAGASKAEVMAQLNRGPDVLSAMENMTPEQIEDYLNRRI